MKECMQECLLRSKACQKKSCRQWIKHKKDLNCVLMAVEKNGRMTLKEVGMRLNISYARVKQIEKEALMKLQKKVISF